jgi:hypothetical protein
MIYLNGFVMYLLIRKNVGTCCLHNAMHEHSSSFLVIHWRTNGDRGFRVELGPPICYVGPPNSLLNLTNLV